jgi:hypothetical protein
MMQRCLNIFKDPLTDLIIKALVALCGLDRATLTPRAATT